MISETEYLLIFGVMMMTTLFLSIMILANRLNRIERILFEEKPKRQQYSYEIDPTTLVYLHKEYIVQKNETKARHTRENAAHGRSLKWEKL